MMLLRNYHVVVFKDNEGVCKKHSVRGWVVFALIGVFLALVAGNIHFWKYYANHEQLQTRLGTSEKTVEEQKTQIISLANKIKVMEDDLVRIRDFDSKLRVMINMDGEQGESITSVGGPEKTNFSSDYLPVYRQELLARKMHSFINQLNTEVRLEEIRQQELMQVIRGSKDLLASTPSIWPTKGWISSSFGYRTSPFTGQREFHKGLDISGKVGTPIYAPAKGSVIFDGVDNGYGKTIVIKHGSGIVTRYAHLHRSAVEKGQDVTRGELIAYVGNTGRSTGPHLHYEVRMNGVCVNPMRYILN